jgi:hypothetical protein
MFQIPKHCSILKKSLEHQNPLNAYITRFIATLLQNVHTNFSVVHSIFGNNDVTTYIKLGPIHWSCGFKALL